MSRLRKRFCPSTTQPPVDDLSPEDDFDTTISRAGKWSTEEESFAKKLIIQFESGTAKDCEEGCTLRAYLARRLNCAPMRVSKKFAGKCIGKVSITLYHYANFQSIHYLIVLFLHL